MFLTDSLRAKNDDRPIFAFHVASYEDGGSEKFVGLFYNVYHIKTITDNNDNIVDYGYPITNWFSSLQDAKKECYDRIKPRSMVSAKLKEQM